jgi:hypothetical protein
VVTGPLGDGGHLVQVRLYLANGVVSGALRLKYHRLSDHLNFGPPVLELEQAEMLRYDQQSAHPARNGAFVRREAVLLAVDRLSTDYTGSHPDLHEQKEPIDVAAAIGHLVVAGALRFRHGTDLRDWLACAPLFVPLTAVTIYGDGPEPALRPWAIMNRSLLSALLF